MHDTVKFRLWLFLHPLHCKDALSRPKLLCILQVAVGRKLNKLFKPMLYVILDLGLCFVSIQLFTIAVLVPQSNIRCPRTIGLSGLITSHLGLLLRSVGSNVAHTFTVSCLLIFTNHFNLPNSSSQLLEKEIGYETLCLYYDNSC